MISDFLWFFRPIFALFFKNVIDIFYSDNIIGFNAHSSLFCCFLDCYLIFFNVTIINKLTHILQIRFNFTHRCYIVFILFIIDFFAAIIFIWVFLMLSFLSLSFSPIFARSTHTPAFKITDCTHTWHSRDAAVFVGLSTLLTFSSIFFLIEVH